MRKRTMSLLVCGIALLVAGAAQADNIVDFAVIRQDEDANGTADLYFSDIWVEVFGATAVDLLTGGGWTVPLTGFGGGEFWLESDEYATLADLNFGIGGTHVLRITHAGGVSDYQYTLGEITDAMFPDIPVLDAVPANIPQNYNFEWTWDDAADDMEAEAEIFGKLYKEESSDEGSFVVGTTTSWVPDFAPETGAGEFLIGYGLGGDVKADDGIAVSGWTLLSGDELFGGGTDEVVDFADSEDEVQFTVVPEPATLLLLALGGLAMLRKRRAN